MTTNQHPPAPPLPHANRTKMLRCTLAQEARIFLGPVDHWRRVQVVLPSSPKVFVGIDVLPSIIAPGGNLRRHALDRIASRETANADRAARVASEVQRGLIPAPSPDGLTLDQALQAVGWNRSYKMPELHPGAPVPFSLGPGQWLTGMAAEGIGVLAVVTEWMP